MDSLCLYGRGRWNQDVPKVKDMAIQVSRGVESAAATHRRRMCGLLGRASQGRCSSKCAAQLKRKLLIIPQLLQVFDSWAGELSPYDFELFSFPTLKYIGHSVRQRLADQGLPTVPLILFAKGASFALKKLADEAGYDVLGLDWCIDPVEARRIVGDKVALQGNMDPNVLYGGREAIEQTVKRMCSGFRSGKGGWVANLGHGITPGVDPEDMRWFLECVHKYSKS
jgi:uroporphyrinogen decarboxylase